MDITANGSCLMLIKGGTGAKPTFSSYEHLQQLLPNKTVKIDLKRGTKRIYLELRICVFFRAKLISNMKAQPLFFVMDYCLSISQFNHL